jgi:hypothetical protein
MEKKANIILKYNFAEDGPITHYPARTTGISDHRVVKRGESFERRIRHFRPIPSDA